MNLLSQQNQTLDGVIIQYGNSRYQVKKLTRKERRLLKQPRSPAPKVAKKLGYQVKPGRVILGNQDKVFLDLKESKGNKDAKIPKMKGRKKFKISYFKHSLRKRCFSDPNITEDVTGDETRDSSQIFLMVDTQDAKRIKECIEEPEEEAEAIKVVENPSLTAPEGTSNTSNKIIKLMSMYSSSRSSKRTDDISLPRSTLLSERLRVNFQSPDRKRNTQVPRIHELEMPHKEGYMHLRARSPNKSLFLDSSSVFTNTKTDKCPDVHQRAKKVKDLLNLVSEQEITDIRTKIFSTFNRS